MKLKLLFTKSEKILKEAGIDTYETESKIIFKEILGRNWFLQENIEYSEVKKIEKIVKQRAGHKPLQYLLGHWEFWNSKFVVGTGVFIPRPETEILVEEALKILKTTEIKTPIVVDLFSGSGCIGISIAKEQPNVNVFLIEKSRKAFYYLEKNLQLNNINNNLKAICADAITLKWDLKLDLITANPPYLKRAELDNSQEEIKSEPRAAFLGGEDGLYFYRKIIKKWGKYLRLGGTFIFEIGSMQAKQVQNLLEPLFKTKVINDLEGNPRVVLGSKIKEYK